MHGYPVGGKDDPYRLTRTERDQYLSGDWLFPNPLQRKGSDLTRVDLVLHTIPRKPPTSRSSPLPETEQPKNLGLREG